MPERSVNGEQWERWTTEWLAEPSQEEARDPRRRGEILRAVRRQTLLMAFGVVAQIAIAAGFGFFGLVLVSGSPGPLEWVTALATWSFVAIALAAAATGERRLWRPASASTRDFVELSLRRLHQRLRNLRWGLYLLALEVAFFVPWIWWVVGSESPGTVTWRTWVGSYGFLALLVAGFAVSIAALRRRTLDRLHRLEALREELGDGG